MSASEIVIEEISGSTRARIVLRGRALPYRGIGTGGEQRIVKTWYQGNPKATQQILGETLDDTTLEGMWKSKFIKLSANDASADVEIQGIPEADGLDGSGINIYPSAIVVKAFERLRARGKELRFSWGDITRYGLLKTVDPVWDRIEDVKWTLVFDWNGKVEQVRRPGRIGRGEAQSDSLDTLLVGADNTLVSMPQRTIPAATRTSIFAQMARIREGMLEFLGYTRQAANAASLPARVVQGAASTVSDIQTDATILSSQMMSIPYETFTATDAVIDVVRAEDFRRTMGLQVDVMTARTIEERNKLQAISFQPNDSIAIRMPANASLHDISLKYYGTEDDWTVIAAANGFNSSEVPTGALVLIPIRNIESVGEVPR